MEHTQSSDTSQADASGFVRNLLRALISLSLLFMVYSIWESQHKPIAPKEQKKSIAPKSPTNLGNGIAAPLSPTPNDEHLSVASGTNTNDITTSKMTEKGGNVETTTPAILPLSVSTSKGPNKVENYRMFAASLYTTPAYNPEKRPETDLVVKAENNLWKKNYTLAIAQLDSVKNTSDQYSAAQRIRGHLYIQQGKIAEATKVFASLKGEENEKYLLLCYLSNAGKNKDFVQLADTLQKRPDFKQNIELQGWITKLNILQKEGKL